MKMVKSGTGNGVPTQGQGTPDFGEGVIAQGFRPDESLLSLDELNIGTTMLLGDEEAERVDLFAGVPGLSESSAVTNHASGISQIASGTSANEEGMPFLPPDSGDSSSQDKDNERGMPSMSSFKTPAAVKDSDQTLGSQAPSFTDYEEHSKENDAMPLHDSITTLQLLPPIQAEVSRVAGEDVWMGIIENHPELSYHQAEIVRQVAGMTPETIDSALDRCVYLLERIRRLGPAALKISQSS